MMIPTVSGSLLNSDRVEFMFVEKTNKGYEIQARILDKPYSVFVIEVVKGDENKAHERLVEIGDWINNSKNPLARLLEPPKRDADRICAYIIEQIKHLRATCTRQGYKLPNSIKRRIETIEHICK